MNTLRSTLSVLALLSSQGIAAADERPNILIVVADDLGYSDIGAMGGEILTPTLDALAARGTLMTDFYAAPFCSPTRAMLMTGADNHQVGFGAMTELVPPDVLKVSGYEGFLNDRAVAFPQLLQDAGYRTYLTGKWHLGVTQETSPAVRGFDRSYALVQGGAGHFDQTGIIAVDPAKSPKAIYREDGVEVDLPTEFYSSTFFVDKMIEYLETDKESDEPFFAYLAFTAPHWPLQAREQDIAKYEGVYDAGYDAIRDSRLARMTDLGIIDPGTEVYPGNNVWPDWSQLDAEQQRAESRRMAVYAAMVDSLDQELGRLVGYLDAQGELDNTFILFMSDNGADGNTPSDVAATRDWIKQNFDNSAENTGSATSYVDYGPGWAQVGSTPFRLYKAFLYEGGIRVPSIAVLPDALRPDQPTGPTDAVAHVMDVAPTVLELAGVQHPGQEYRGKPVAPIMGFSMLPLLAGKSDYVQDQTRSIGWELQGRKAMRKGDWKVVYSNSPWGTDMWELYNLSTDPTELHDLAGAQPDKVKELVADYNAWTTQTGAIDLTSLGETVGYSNGREYYEDLVAKD